MGHVTVYVLAIQWCGVHEAISCIAEESNAILEQTGLSVMLERKLVCLCNFPIMYLPSCAILLVVCCIFRIHVAGTDTISQSVESYLTVVDHVWLAQAYPKCTVVVDL